MANAVEAYKEAWDAYSNNPKPYILNGLALLLVTLIVLPVILAASFAPALLDRFGIGVTDATRLLVVALSMVVSMAFAVAVSAITKSFYGVCNDLAEGTKVEWHSLYGHARRSWKALAGIAIIQIIFVTVLAALIAGASAMISQALLGSPVLVILAVIILVPVAILVAMLFEPAYPIALVEYAGVFGSIRKGFGLIRRNPVQFLILVIFTGLLEVLNFVPMVQQLFTTPLNASALLIFYKQDRVDMGKEKAGRRKR